MAAVTSVLFRNYSRGVNRLLLSNPCLSSLSGQVHLRHDDKLSNRVVLHSRPLSLTPKWSVEAMDCKAVKDHTKLWTVERGLSLALVGIIPAAFIFPSSAMDYLLAFSVTLHAHWGLETIVVDYVRPKVVGPTIAKLGVVSVYALSAMALGGLFYFNYSDVGLVNAIKMLWKL